MIKLACKRVLIAAAVCAFAAVVPGSFAQTSSALNDLATHSYHPPGMPTRSAHPDAPKTRISTAAVPLNNTAYSQIGALLQEKQARTATQKKVSSKVLYTSRMLRGMAAAPGVQYLDTAAAVDDHNRIAVDINATISEDLLNRLSNAGAAVLYSSKRYHAVRALVPADKVEMIAGWQEVRFISPKREARTARILSATNKGNAVSNRLRAGLNAAGNGVVVPHSEGDVAMMADQARLLGIDGTGLKVGVLSDGVTSLVQSQLLGALGPVTVLPGQEGSGDEGTAMLEIVHALAPGATLYFATAFNGMESFADNIRALRAAGCDIIVDDVTYFAETPFQNGQDATVYENGTYTNGGVVIQSVNDVTADGAFYFSSAGNEGAMDSGSAGTWEGDYKPGGSVPPALPAGVGVHLFGSLPYNTINSYGEIAILNWADPLGASANDYDLFVISSDGTTVWDASTDIQDGTGDPFEFIGDYLYPGDHIVITKMPSAQKVFLHLETWRTYLDQGTTGSTFGHNGAPATFTVAAAPACLPIGPGYPTGPCTSPFTASQMLEPYSSDGPRQMFFEADGTPMTAGNFTSTGGKIYPKPDFTGADGVSVTGVGGFGSPFFGTSAAAPHAAAVAALVKSAIPTIDVNELAAALNGTAIDVLLHGPDPVSGNGILMAKAAVNDAGLTTGVANPAIVTAVASENPGNGDGAVTAGEGALLTITLGNTAGAAKATAISGTLSAVTDGVYVTLPSASTFADLAVGASAANDNMLTFTLPGNFDDCAGKADFALTLNYAGGPASTRTLFFNAPVGPSLVTISGSLGNMGTAGTMLTKGKNAAAPTIVGTTGTQTGRLFRDGVPSVCGSPKTSPSMYDAAPHLFDSYSMTACRTGCVQVQLYEPNIDLLTGTEMLFGSAYIPSFNPANPLTNYAGDAGSSSMYSTFGVDATAGSDMAVTVTDVLGTTSAGASYTLGVPGCMLTCGAATMPPIAVVHDVTVEPGDDGKAAASIDNGSNSPSGLAITMTQIPAGPYEMGDTTVMLTVVDAYGATAQASAVVTVLPALSIAPASGSSSKTVTAGQTASYTLNVKSNMATGITFTCSGLPDKSSCSFGAFTPVTSSLTSGTVGLTITTTASSTTASLMAIPPAGNSQIPIYAVFALPFAGLAGLGRCKNRKAIMRMLVMMVIIIVAIGWASCGGSSKTPTPITVPGTPAGTYAVTITGSNATMSTTTTVNLVVQ